jgi:hypothetical protein
MSIRSCLLKAGMVLVLSCIAGLGSAARANDCSTALVAESCGCQGVPAQSSDAAKSAEARPKRSVSNGRKLVQSPAKARASRASASRAGL